MDMPRIDRPIDRLTAAIDALADRMDPAIPADEAARLRAEAHGAVDILERHHRRKQRTVRHAHAHDDDQGDH
ncbi:hypothetical protein Prubr_01620 [Polymorphospora rubra]|uniref:Uncharacterized protein n=2 Tax=Polymorphospora rubra TaxID=338584 RepID=A0A810MPZ2_9ACTN|nr:hypothetical protein Prubr_01620 [Polymorphospora rubra]